MTNVIKEICCGSLIGAANIMPGISGGILAVSMGVYDRIIYAVTHIRKDWEQSVKILMPIGFGAILGFAGLSYVIQWMFSKYPVQTNLLFTGLVLGGIPEIWKIVRQEKTGIWKMIMFVFMFLFLSILPFLNGDGETVILELSVLGEIKLFGIGILAAATMVIPGVSGSMILIFLGYYEPLLNEITSCMNGFLRMNLQEMVQGILILGPAVLGLIFGVFLIAGFMEYLLNHHKAITYWAILGLVFASPVGILSEICKYPVDFFTIFTGIAACIVGVFTAFFLGEKES